MCTMRILVALALVAVASAATVQVDSPFGYHQRVGIPEAARIQAAEDRLFNQEEQEVRIVGGVVAANNAHPYLGGLVISLLNIAGSSVCGSSLLTANRLVTAAHCWFDGTNQAWQFTVVLGSAYLFTGGTRIATSNIIVHPAWEPSTIANDVAMIYLPTSVVFSAAIQPISLPSGTQLVETFAGEWATAAGYGKTSDAQSGVTTATMVSQVSLQVITLAQCQASFGTWAQASNICTSGAGGVGVCGGDSGGPLVLNRNGQPILVGISSFVALAGCQLGFPSAFASVNSFYGFIIQHLF